MSELDHIKMKDTYTINNFAENLSKLSMKAASLGETIEEAKLVKKFLNSFPRNKYIPIIASLNKC